MNDSAVQKQLSIMVSFIEKEAQEKASEIKVKAEEEFTIEKARIVQTQKQKITQEFERKMKQVIVSKKIAHSNELSKSRLELLKRREGGVQAIFDNAKSRLDDISRTPEYKDLLVDLIIQAIQKLEETVVDVTVREEDVAVARAAIPLATEKFNKIKGQNAEITLNTEQFLAPSPRNAGKALVTCAGGVVLSAQKGRIVCNNTLDARLTYGYEKSVPELRKRLFGNVENL